MKKDTTITEIGHGEYIALTRNFMYTLASTCLSLCCLSMPFFLGTKLPFPMFQPVGGKCIAANVRLALKSWLSSHMSDISVKAYDTKLKL